MNYYLIENEGEIDKNALRLIGATTKDGETQIGYFGTGIKYALATALRKEIPIRIFSGEDEIEITTETVQMRGLDFEVICLDGIQTSITTEMGRDWETWFVIREFYCNAIDEGSNDIKPTDEVSGIDGVTRVYIGITQETHDILTNMDQYFDTKRVPVFESPGVKVFHRANSEHMIVYRRGVRVFNKGDSLYDYDIDRLVISEARTSELFEINYEMIRYWRNHATPEMVVALYGSPQSHEFNLDWEYLASEKMCDGWWIALKDRVIIPKEQTGYFADELSEFTIQLPHKLCVQLHKVFGETLHIKGMLDTKSVIAPTEITEREASYINRALEFLSRTSYFSEIDKDQIKVAMLEGAALGQAHNNTIYLSPDVFTQGLKAVVGTIMEEWLHIKSRASDRTRLFQDTLIEITITVLEEQSGVYL